VTIEAFCLTNVEAAIGRGQLRLCASGRISQAFCAGTLTSAPSCQRLGTRGQNVQAGRPSKLLVLVPRQGLDHNCLTSVLVHCAQGNVAAPGLLVIVSDHVRFLSGFFSPALPPRPRDILFFFLFVDVIFDLLWSVLKSKPYHVEEVVATTWRFGALWPYL